VRAMLSQILLSSKGCSMKNLQQNVTGEIFSLSYYSCKSF
jgi:hypothetical protein